MPVEFLTSEQESKYGKYTSEPSQEQLAKYIMLDDQDRLFIFRHKGEHKYCRTLLFHVARRGGGRPLAFIDTAALILKM